MENSFQTSFIPKKPIIPNATSSGGGSTTSISMVVSVFILVVMILAFGGLYVYKNFYLLKNKESLSANLFKIRDSFNKDTITLLETFDKRTSIAKQILEGHVVLSPLFEKINELTLSSIQYTKFEHKVNNNLFIVRMSGIARDYKSIAIQADIFNADKGQVFKNVIFSNLTKDKNNFVTFDVEFSVDPSLLSYSNNVSNSKPETSAPAPAQIQIPTPAPNPTTTTTNPAQPNVATPLSVTNNTQ
ncbi:MAG: hypothetical protein WCW04_01465 [Candidatus Paceibacterota bacterium]|jgi:acetolactate synthase small subunit